MRPKTQKVHKKKQTTFSSALDVVCTEQATQTDCEPTGSDVTNKETGIEAAEPAHAPCESGPRNVDVCLWSGNNAICDDDRSSQVAALETKVLEQERRYRDLEEIVGKLQKKHEEEDISQHGGTKTHVRNLKDTRNNKVNDNQPPLTCVEVNNVSTTSFTKAPSLAPAVTACIPYGVSVDVFTGSVLTCFNDVVCNTGDQYDPVTGEFKADLDGLYLASISLRQLGTGYICIDVMSRTRGALRNERKVCGAHTLMPDTSASGLGVVQLREGDVIYLKGLQRGGAKLNMHSSFSCFMIR
ncbi:uncharacterized protein LOC131954121 [Physella acuta]|uniref:uncharacterized protein LOC131954121 n=1 Tax=Physella acuta TaxID=109671 RepID=UPI0027DB2CE9|nr:uncharacterized protein LOC131954121 [Physella acuta]XP_059173634.1 uncharacterized protein LOC131954121 [Physella acuta]